MDDRSGFSKDSRCPNTIFPFWGARNLPNLCCRGLILRNFSRSLHYPRPGPFLPTSYRCAPDSWRRGSGAMLTMLGFLRFFNLCFTALFSRRLFSLTLFLISLFEIWPRIWRISIGRASKCGLTLLAPLWSHVKTENRVVGHPKEARNRKLRIIVLPSSLPSGRSNEGSRQAAAHRKKKSLSY